jgi:hypothetical protein
VNEKWIMCERCKRAAKLNVMMPRCTECHWEPFREEKAAPKMESNEGT